MLQVIPFQSGPVKHKAFQIPPEIFLIQKAALTLLTSQMFSLVMVA